ncbi:MAG: hypothetical protein AAGK05_16810 [Pseudomonadota bacterium]
MEHLAPEEKAEKALEVMDTATADQAKELAPPDGEEKAEGRREEKKEEEEAMETEEPAPTRQSAAEGAVTAEEKEEELRKKEDEEKEAESEMDAVDRRATEASAFFTRHEVLAPLPPELMAELFDTSSPGAAESSPGAAVPRERRQAAERACCSTRRQ